MGRPRDRASGMGLLPRMEARPHKNGTTVTYRYHPVGGKPINLGTDKAAALRRVLDMNGQQAPGEIYGSLRWVWQRFQDSSRWKRLADATRTDYLSAWKQLDDRLGHMHMGEITSFVVARYVHVERADSPRRADIEKSLLSRLFGQGIKLGVAALNATIGVEPHGSEPRTEAPDPAVLARFLNWIGQQTPQRRIIGMAAEYASLAGNRQAEFLALTWPQVDREAGEIRLLRAKQRGRKRGRVVEVIDITPTLGALLDRLAALHRERGVDSIYVFPTRDNNAYTSRGFKTLWQRCVLRAIEEGVLSVGDRFTFHDLRAYYTTQHKTQFGELPDLHKNPATTARVYDRTTEVKRSAL